MDRISRLFGKKTEPTGSQGPLPGEPSQPVSDATAEGHPAGMGHPPNQENSVKRPLPASLDYGLKFILADQSEHLFNNLPISIGRGKQNNLIVDDPSASDEHAVVYFDEAVHDVCIADQDSLNGLCIDGMPSRKNVLHDGVSIKIGGAEICFRDTGYIHSS